MKRIIAIALVLILAGCSSNRQEGDLAPDFEVMRIDGNTFKLNQLRGKYVLLYFWGSWCGPCRQEAPALGIVHSNFQESEFVDGEGFEIVSVALEKNGDKAHEVANDLGFNWPNQIVEESPFVRMSPLGSMYGVSEIPSKFLIDPEGKIVLSYTELEVVNEYLSTRVKE